MLQVLAEILSNIQVCQIFVSLPCTEKCQSLQIHRNMCLLKLENETVVTTLLPRGIYLCPKEMANFIQDGNLVSVRAQMEENSSLISSISADLLADVSQVFVNEPLQETLIKEKLSATCKKCSYSLYPDVKFRRVLPLPSVDWDQASEGWFCHLHNEDRRKLKPMSLIPNQDECFYSELFFMLNCSALDNMNVNVKDGSRLFCTSCGEVLGEKTSCSVKLWTPNVEWLQDNGSVLFSRNVESILLSLFGNIDKDNFGVNCRLVLTVKVLNLYLYMVTMNTNLKLLLSESHKSDNTLDSSACDNNKRSRGEEDYQVKLKARYAIKLLYQIKDKDDEETGLWHDDVNVHLLPCDFSFFSSIKLLLETSAQYLPNDMRVFGNMNVGYVMKS